MSLVVGYLPETLCTSSDLMVTYCWSPTPIFGAFISLKFINVTVYIDDILISGERESDHLQSLEEMLKHLVEAGLRVKNQTQS